MRHENIHVLSLYIKQVIVPKVYCLIKSPELKDQIFINFRENIDFEITEICYSNYFKNISDIADAIIFTKVALYAIEHSIDYTIERYAAKTNSTLLLTMALNIIESPDDFAEFVVSSIINED